MLRRILLKFGAVALILFGTLSMQSQETKSENEQKQAFINSLTDTQKADYKSYREQKKALRKTMEATFSPEQLVILNNSELDKKAKREALKQTYTDAQKEQHKANKMTNKSAKEAFVATLSEEQKALMPKGLQVKQGKGKKKGKKKAQE